MELDSLLLRQKKDFGNSFIKLRIVGSGLAAFTAREEILMVVLGLEEMLLKRRIAFLG